MREVLNKGFVRLVDSMGDDLTVVKSARVSYGSDTKGPEKDQKLIKFLLANNHETPFEHLVFTFHIKCPLFVARQWMRHRMGSFNEISGRYTEIEDDFYIPTAFRKAAGSNYLFEPMTEGENNKLYSKFENYYAWSFNFYKKLLSEGVSKEQARIILPLGTFTEFYWTVNARYLMNFLKLRMDEHAQWEIQQYAFILMDFFKEKAPWTADAFIASQK